MSQHSSKIVQIIQAEGWSAVYDTADGVDAVPLAAWALLEDQHGDRWVAGLDMSGPNPRGNVPCEDKPGFVHYVHANEP